MAKVGILVHCRQLETENWEELVFGDPTNDKLGDQATLARVLLTLCADDDVACIVFGRGPSHKDGMNEAEYTKKYLLDNFDRLSLFPSLTPLFDKVGSEGREVLRQKMAAVMATEEVYNTTAEIAAASAIFNDHGVQKVIQICAATHAPRCLKEQLVAREKGLVDHAQLWMTVATDVGYKGTTAKDVFVVEPLHRVDQPMTHFKPTLHEAIAPYYSLPEEDKKAFNRLVADFMQARK